MVVDLNPHNLSKAQKLLSHIKNISKGEYTTTPYQVVSEAQALPDVHLSFTIPEDLSDTLKNKIAEDNLKEVQFALGRYLREASKLTGAARDLIKAASKDEEEKKDEEPTEKTIPDDIKKERKEKETNEEQAGDKGENENKDITAQEGLVEEETTGSGQTKSDSYNLLGISHDATEEEARKAYRRIAVLNNADVVEARLRNQGFTTEQIRNHPEYLESEERMKQASMAYESLKRKYKNEAPRKTDGKNQDNDTSWKLIIQLNPTLDESDETKNAEKNTLGFRESFKTSGYIEYEKVEIDKLKRAGFIPDHYSYEQAASALNTAGLIFIDGGDPRKLVSAIENNRSLDSNTNQFLNTVALNVGGLKAANPTLSQNLNRAAGSPDIEIKKINKDSKITGSSNQILMEFSNNVLIPIYEKFKSAITTTAKQELKRFVTKSLESQAAKNFVKWATKVGLKTALEGITQTIGSSIPIVGNFIAWLATEVIGKAVEKTLIFLKKLFKDNKEVAAGLGILTLGVGAIVGSIPLMILGGSMFGAMVITAGTGVAIAGTGAVLVGVYGFVVTTIVTTVPRFFGTIILGFILVAVFTIFIINNGAYVTPKFEFLDSAFGTPFNCSLNPEKGPVSFSNSNSSPIAHRAWEITSDLYQGFWCFWNRSPGDLPSDIKTYLPTYPELFNMDMFRSNPNPTRDEISSCGECLFWCTWLVQKSYKENGVSIQNTLMSNTMQGDFMSRNKFIPAESATRPGQNPISNNVKPGSVIFFDVQNSLNRTDHVGIAHTISVAGIKFVQSNAGTKDGTLSFKSGGVGIVDPGGIHVVGFGLP